jgi:tRNA-dihydrouridine synthase
MLGRGAIADPFLAASIKGDAAAGALKAGEKLAIVKAFHDDLYSGYREILSGPAHLLDKMKEVWTYLAPSFPGKGQLLGQVARAKTAEAYGSAVKRLFS